MRQVVAKGRFEPFREIGRDRLCGASDAPSMRLWDERMTRRAASGSHDPAGDDRTRDDRDDSRSDREIVGAVLNGESAAFDRLVGRYRLPLLSLALSRGLSPESADEAVQETFLAAYRYLPGYDSAYAFRTWLWTILLNQCRRRGAIESRERAMRRVDDDDSDGVRGDESPSAEPDPSTAAIRREDHERLLASIDELNETQAEAIRLRFFGQATYPEIARQQQCSLATAKNRVRAGLDALALRLADPSPSTLDRTTHQPKGTGAGR